MIALDKFVDMLTANLELQNEYVVVFVFAFVILPKYLLKMRRKRSLNYIYYNKSSIIGYNDSLRFKTIN